MNKKQTETPRDWQEGRRVRAWELSEQGWKPAKIADALGVSRGAVSQWLKRGREGGVAALRHRPAPGAPARLTEAQRSQLPSLLAQGAEHFGFRGEVWTRERVGEVIWREFGVRYHPTQVGRILKAIRWTRQKPKQRATQRDEAAIQHWRESEWEAIKKKARAEGRTIVFVDEAGFYLLPGVVKTYAPCGQTPVLRVPLSRDHLSVISAVTPEGKLYVRVQDRAFQAKDVVRFLRHLLGHIPGLLLVVWDGLPAHRSQVIKDFLAQGAAARLHLEGLPGYAPDLNPDEGIWHYLKHVELKNLCCQNFPQLRLELRRAIQRLRHKLPVILGCFALAGLPV